MTELKKLLEATIAPYVQGEFVSVENATAAANAVKAAMQDRGYSEAEQAEYLAAFVRGLLSDPTTRGWRNAAIRVMGDGFGFDIAVTVSTDETQLSITLTPRPVQ